MMCNTTQVSLLLTKSDVHAAQHTYTSFPMLPTCSRTSMATWEARLGRRMHAIYVADDICILTSRTPRMCQLFHIVAKAPYSSENECYIRYMQYGGRYLHVSVVVSMMMRT